MKSAPSRAIDLSILAIPFAMSALAYPHLPAVIPTHWNAAGVANGFMPKATGAWLMPAVIVGMVAVLLVVAHFAGRDSAPKGLAQAMVATSRTTSLFLTFIHTVALLIALGRDIDMTAAAWSGTAVLLAVLGASYYLIFRKAVAREG